MSHRAYQPTQSCGSKLLQQRWDKTYYDEHRRLVKTARPVVDTKTPPKPPHVVAKLKKQQLEKERAEEIDRDNQTLMLRMQKIMTTHVSIDHHKHHSLNDRKRQRELERVAKENKAMLQRLEKVQPVYRITDWIDDWRRSEELTQRITAYPAPSPTRSKSACRGTRMSATPGGLDQSEGVSEKVTTKDVQGDLEISEVPPESEKQLGTT